jgi:hypothetical protein
VTWWAWTFLWASLVAASAWLAFLLGRSLWRRTVALARELNTAAERFAALSEELATLAERQPQPPELAVFADPGELRRDRAASGRHRARHQTPAGRPAAPRRNG